MKRKEQKAARQKKKTDNGQSTTVGELQLQLENEAGIEQDKPLEAWTLGQCDGTKFSLVTKLMMIGEYSKFTST